MKFYCLIFLIPLFLTVDDVEAQRRRRSPRNTVQRRTQLPRPTTMTRQPVAHVLPPAGNQASAITNPRQTIVQAAYHAGVPVAKDRIPGVTSPPSAVPSSVGQVARPPFENEHAWPRQIDPVAQAWAQREADTLVRNGKGLYDRYPMQYGHPNGNCPGSNVTGTGRTFGPPIPASSDPISTCEPRGSERSRAVLIAEAAAYDPKSGCWFGCRAWILR